MHSHHAPAGSGANQQVQAGRPAQVDRLRRCTMAAPMRVSFSVDAGRIEWPHARRRIQVTTTSRWTLWMMPAPTSWISLLGSAAAGHDDPG
jgi:hypothetical protein